MNDSVDIPEENIKKWDNEKSACFIDNIDDDKVNKILDELKSLEENVDNIYSVDSTVDKICCMLIESAKTTFVKLVIFSKFGDTMYSSRPH
jgi:hypothetical protein